jgi:hypothetical protein
MKISFITFFIEERNFLSDFSATRSFHSFFHSPSRLLFPWLPERKIYMKMQKLSVALLYALAAVPSESKIFRLLCFLAEKPIVLPTHKKRSSEVSSLGARSSTPLLG